LCNDEKSENAQFSASILASGPFSALLGQVRIRRELCGNFSAGLFALHQGIDIAGAGPSKQAEKLNKENK
jgi:hypothetical protein